MTTIDQSYRVTIEAGDVTLTTADVTVYDVVVPAWTRVRVLSKSNAGFRGIEVYVRVLDEEVAVALTTSPRRRAAARELGVTPTPTLTLSAGLVQSRRA